MERLASFLYRLIHRPGRLHQNADALLRIPTVGEERRDVDSVVSLEVVAVNITDAEGRPSTAGLMEQEWDFEKAQKEDPDVNLLRQWKMEARVDTLEQLKTHPILKKFVGVCGTN